MWPSVGQLRVPWVDLARMVNWVACTIESESSRTRSVGVFGREINLTH